MAASPPKHRWIGLIVILVVCFAAAGIGGAVTTPKIPGWYTTLAKPSWNPPNWTFGPVWSALYLAMAVAAWLVWRQGDWSSARLPLALFGVQLALNVLWSCLFFGLQNPGLAFAVVVLLWAAITVTMVTFWLPSTAAGLLFVPYLGWLSRGGGASGPGTASDRMNARWIRRPGGIRLEFTTPAAVHTR